MAGGPINGVPVPVFSGGKPGDNSLFIDVGDEFVGSKRLAEIKTRPVGLVIPTILQTSADLVSWFSSITCLYNKHWFAEGDRVTTPICFFNVTSVSEDWQVTTSKKRVILYEPDGELDAREAANPVREGVMQTIVDNRVAEPKTYSLGIVIPFQPLGRRFTEGVKTATDMLFGMFDILSGVAGQPTGVSFVRNLLSVALQGVDIVQGLSEIAGKLPETQGVNYINKNSLEAMIESGMLLTMKMWTGFDYKYVLITGGHIEKRPMEDDVFRGTLQLQEVPVLSISPPAGMERARIKREWNGSPLTDIDMMIQSAVVAPLAEYTGVAEASGDVKTTKEQVLSSLGI